MSVTVGKVLELLDTIAPLDGAEEWDNVGLLAGSKDASVENILCALDLTQGVLDEAEEKGAKLIVTHHPILFRGRKNLREDDSEGRLLCRLIRSGIALIAMHTNFDNAHPGVNDVLAQKLNLRDVAPLESGMCIGSVDGITLDEFAQVVRESLHTPVRVYGNSETVVNRAAVMGGSGGDYGSIAQRACADVFVTGEVSYHRAMTFADEGLCVIEAGHAETENPAILMLANGLQIALNDVQYNVNVFCSA